MENILFLYLSWYFWDVPKNILAGWRNFLKFGLNYFSLSLLLQNFFSPWRRYRMGYGRGFNLGRYFEAFTFNLMSRGIGVVLRLFFILLCLLTEIFIFLIGLIVLLGWLILPIILIGGIIFGFKILL